jgi:hypothetical protein
MSLLPTYHLTVPLLRSANRGEAWRPTKPGANPAAIAKVERKVSAVNFMVRLLGGIRGGWVCVSSGVVRWRLSPFMDTMSEMIAGSGGSLFYFYI